MILKFVIMKKHNLSKLFIFSRKFLEQLFFRSKVDQDKTANETGWINLHFNV